jgi:hypothetical protein
MRLQQSTTSDASVSTWTSGDRKRVFWPDAVAYREAVQTPHVALADPALQEAGISLDRRGLPIAYAGRFAIVFKLVAPSGETWALRCFTTSGDENGTGRSHRYRLMQPHVDAHRTIFAPFRYIEKGIKIGANWYPVLVMRWATGEPLGRWVERHRNDPAKLQTLCGALSELLVSLEEGGIAHGDWQHDNLLVADDGARVTLVDYDGMFVPELDGQPNTELGHPNYQHPARTAEHFGPGLDRFSCLAIQTALLGLSRDPGLWERFSDGESLLFKREDYRNPDASPVFNELRAIAELDSDDTLADAIARLEDACRAGAMSTLLPAITAAERAENAPAYEPITLAASPWKTTTTKAPWIAESESQSVGSDWLQDHTTTPTGTTGPRVAKGTPGGIGRWWMLPEVVTKVTTAPLQQPVMQRPRRNVSVAVQPQDVFTFIEREKSEETYRNEIKHLWTWRFGATALVAFFGLLIYAAARSNNWFLPVYFAWILNYATLGYSRWPRKAIHDELTQEIEKMNVQIENRNKQIAEKGGVALTAVGANGQPLTTVSEFVAERLRQISINRVLTLPGIHVSTLRQLRQEGIHNALDLQRRTNLPSVPPHQVTALQNWIREQEADAAANYRKTVGTTRSIPNEVSRLRNEVAAFEREVTHLKQEKDQFPDVSVATYLRRLFGQEEVPPPSLSSAPNSGGTP